VSEDGVQRPDVVGQSPLDLVAVRAARRHPLPDSVVPTLINISENITYRLDDPIGGGRWALRVHREGYHSRRAIASELSWLRALSESSAANVPLPLRGNDGEFIQTLAVGAGMAPRNAVLFGWEQGSEPASDDITGYERLGETAARMHKHVKAWQRPPWFERHTWDFATTLGDAPHWGRWRDGIGMTPAIEAAIADAAGVIEQRLAQIGKGPEVFNLVHGDMRLANLLLDGSTVKVIDFDDCGFSWFLYDCATTVSFFEEKPEVPELIKAWVRGYRRVGVLDPIAEADIETFVMLRRILLVAWIGSHADTELARSMGASYSEGTVPLCERYLSRFGKARQPARTSGPIRARWWKRLFA
jgi:Ser/Thr protein kinase RdoA (MazF antagonist)